MAESRGELEVYNQWFAAADLDRDGVLSGIEAVTFFQRSGLPQNPTLFKVWQYVAGDRPALSRQEFYTAMKLVSLAQLNGGVLDDQQALRLVNGLAGPVPLPRLQGLAVPRGIDLPAHLLPPAPGAPRSGLPPPPSPQQQAQQQGFSPARPSPGGIPSQSPSRPATAGFPPVSPPPPAGGAPAFPPLSAEQAAAFQTAFSQLDTDRDGFVQGTDCFGAFMQSGLPKAALKQIWDLVAGDEARLNRHQFVQALYLVECVKRGMQVPAALPPGPFPPVAGTVSIGGMSAPSDIYASANLVMPGMVARQAYHPQPAAPLPFASQVPGLPQDRLAALDPTERMRLEGEREAALRAEAEQRKAEEERAAAAAKREFFTRTLGEMRLTQSRVTRAVVEAQQRCEMERAAADQMESDYNRAYAEFSMKHAQSAPLVQTLKQTQEEKAALTQKLDSLRAMVQQLEEFDPEWETREKGECEALNLEIAALTVQQEQLARRAEATQQRRDAMLAQVASLKEGAAGAEGELAGLQEAVDKVAAEGGQDKEAVVGLLRQLAPLYNKLYDAAKAAMMPLPAEAVASMKREASPFKYDQLAAAAAEDWGSFKDEGFKIVSALPVDTRLTTFAPPSAAAALDREEAAAQEAAAAAAAGAGQGPPAAEGSAAAADPADPAAAAAAAADAEDVVAKGQQPLDKASSNAQAEAVSAAAEAGVLASAIAEALAGVPVPAAGGGSKPASRQASLSGAKAAEEPQAAAKPGEEAAAAAAAPVEVAAVPAAEASNPFEVSFENGGAAGEEAAAAAAAPTVAAGVDAFAAFDAAAAGAAAEAPAAALGPVVKQASGAFGSSQALPAAESPTAGAAAAAAAAGEAPAEPAAGAAKPPASEGGGWTSF